MSKHIDDISDEELKALLDDLDGKQSQEKKQKPADGKEIKFVRMSDVKPEEVSWLWDPYVPLGKITLLEGDPGCGKTWAALAIASAISTGSALPDGDSGRCIMKRAPGKVIYLTAEDGIADTLRPRLDAVKADVENIYAITGTQDESGDNAFSFADLALLDGMAEALKPALVVIDPLQAFLGASIDMHRANEVRPLLARLAALAERHKCAMLCIIHLSKATASKSIYRGMGSIDFTAAARSVLLAGSDPQDTKRRALVHIKSSLAAAGQSQGFELGDNFFWTGISELTAGALLANEVNLADKKNKLDSAVEWLTEIQDEDISLMTLRRVKEKLCIKAYKKPGEKNGPYLWELPGNNFQSDNDNIIPFGMVPKGKKMSNPSTRNYSSNDADSMGRSSKNNEQNMEVNGVKTSGDSYGLFNNVPLEEQPKNQQNEQSVTETATGNNGNQLQDILGQEVDIDELPF
ncbi:MAG: DNA repair protein RadA [Pelotomaculum sp. PtaB.Bin013]|uniref:AAA family ATPase n=1 Tax=Pelotomaculum isophthalicicum JI TaxID=947010 RepID=A0A9X4H3V0_9FIRM|nr:AAA family ATPase [Pelotomaculum isophthalicicum]MDF9408268.1 AAA family ATPase [Pelotomaculum isophthalicicum JI]OPX91614.1 MAG: DNA repair protein RadA [Pelotomaculum sp. PtaB.Bin013]